MLAGCAGFNGRPNAVITLKQADRMVAAYPPDAAIQTLGTIGVDDVAGRNTYRGRVIAAYLTAIDAHYDQFVTELSRSGKSFHVGIDTLILGLTGAGAIAHAAASGLSAGATAVGGLRGSVDRELFADKTLPILISLMDSRRLEARADIITGLAKPETAYTLEEGFSDLSRYQAAGTIDGALSSAATAAGQQAAKADSEFGKAKDLCAVDNVTAKKRHDLMGALESLERYAVAQPGKAVQQRQAIQAAARQVGIPADSAPADHDAAMHMLASIRDQIEAQCDSTGVDALRVKITEKVTLP